VELWQDLLREGIELIALTEEVGLVGRHQLDDLLELQLALATLLQREVVLRVAATAGRAESVSQTELEPREGAVGEEDPRSRLDEVADRRELGPGHRRGEGSETTQHHR